MGHDLCFSLMLAAGHWALQGGDALQVAKSCLQTDKLGGAVIPGILDWFARSLF